MHMNRSQRVCVCVSVSVCICVGEIKACSMPNQLNDTHRTFKGRHSAFE